MDNIIRQKLQMYEQNGGQPISPDDPDVQAALEFTARVLAGERPEMVDIFREQVQERADSPLEEPMATYKQSGGYDKCRKPKDNWGKWQVCNGDPAAHKAHSLAHIPAPPKNVEISWAERDDPDYPPDRFLPGEPDDVEMEYGEIVYDEVSPARSADVERGLWIPSPLRDLPKSDISDRVLTMLTREQQLAKEIGEGDDDVFYPPGGKHPPRSPPKPVEPYIKRPYTAYNTPAAATITPVAATRITTITPAQIEALGRSSHIRAQSSGSGIQFTPTPTQPRSMNPKHFVQNNAFAASSPFVINSANQPTNPRQAGNPPVVRMISNLRPEVPEFSLTPVAPTNGLLSLLSGGRGGDVEATTLTANQSLEARVVSSKLNLDKAIESVVDEAKVDGDEYLSRSNMYGQSDSINQNNSNYGYHTRNPSGAAVAGMGPGRLGGSYFGGSNMTGSSMVGSSVSILNSGFGAASLGGNNVGMGNLPSPLANPYHQDLHAATSSHNPCLEHPTPGSYVHPPKGRAVHFANNSSPYGGHVANRSFDKNVYTGGGMVSPDAFASKICRPVSVTGQRGAYGPVVGTTHGHGTMSFGRGQIHNSNSPEGTSTTKLRTSDSCPGPTLKRTSGGRFLDYQRYL